MSDGLPSCAGALISAEPNVVESTAAELWRWPSATSRPIGALVDERAIYWFEDSGAIWRLAKGSSVAQQLRPAPERPVWIRGFVADAERLYWGESELISPPLEPATPTLPGRLWSADKVAPVIDYADARPNPPLPDSPLYRMLLESGRIERIETPGFSSPNFSFILGEDAEQLYVTTPEALVSIQKPAARSE